jgi:hypothetical protein
VRLFFRILGHPITGIYSVQIMGSEMRGLVEVLGGFGIKLLVGPWLPFLTDICFISFSQL